MKLCKAPGLERPGFGGMNGHPGSAARLGVWPAGLVYFGRFPATLHD